MTRELSPDELARRPASAGLRWPCFRRRFCWPAGVSKGAGTDRTPWPWMSLSTGCGVGLRPFPMKALIPRACAPVFLAAAAPARCARCARRGGCARCRPRGPAAAGLQARLGSSAGAAPCRARPRPPPAGEETDLADAVRSDRSPPDTHLARAVDDVAPTPILQAYPPPCLRWCRRLLKPRFWPPTTRRCPADESGRPGAG